jgi:hypothetical protein
MSVNEGSEFPLFIAVLGGFGLDINITKRIFATPILRGGVIVNSEPMIFTFDIVIPVVYTF